MQKETERLKTKLEELLKEFHGITEYHTELRRANNIVSDEQMGILWQLQKQIWKLKNELRRAEFCGMIDEIKNYAFLWQAGEFSAEELSPVLYLFSTLMIPVNESDDPVFDSYLKTRKDILQFAWFFSNHVANNGPEGFETFVKELARNIGLPTFSNSMSVFLSWLDFNAVEITMAYYRSITE